MNKIHYSVVYFVLRFCGKCAPGPAGHGPARVKNISFYPHASISSGIQMVASLEFSIVALFFPFFFAIGLDGTSSFCCFRSSAASPQIVENLGLKCRVV